ncbi:sugar kinase [Litorivivens sp.]|uniref:sugar kinase n=1 Tax=Litorivivens sp. TaxID=2020868 RepID=UPI00356B3B69
MVVTCLGEVMLELRPADSSSQLSLGVGGDTFNTAVMLSRENVSTGYLTALGKDRFSDQILDRAHAEGVGTAGVQFDSDALPGLYLIQNDASGEREFFYWRDHSPSRRLFDSDEKLKVCIEYCCKSEWLYLSGITVAVMAQQQKRRFLEFLKALKNTGVSIAFDPNYRPRLWDSVEDAKLWHATLMGYSDLVLPTLVDEQALWGADSAKSVIEHCQAAGVTTVVVKCPNAQAVAWNGNESVECGTRYRGLVVDTTGAGDAFNAGFLAAHLAGQCLAECLQRAHEVASRVLAVRGALP